MSGHNMGTNQKEIVKHVCPGAREASWGWQRLVNKGEQARYYKSCHALGTELKKTDANSNTNTEEKKIQKKYRYKGEQACNRSCHALGPRFRKKTLNCKTIKQLTDWNLWKYFIWISVNISVTFCSPGPGGPDITLGGLSADRSQ